MIFEIQHFRDRNNHRFSSSQPFSETLLTLRYRAEKGRIIVDIENHRLEQTKRIED